MTEKCNKLDMFRVRDMFHIRDVLHKQRGMLNKKRNA